MYQTANTLQETIPHNRWKVCPEKKEEMRTYAEQLLHDAEKWMVDNPTTPTNHYEVVGRLSKEVRDLEHALDGGNAYMLSFELHDLIMKSFCLKILSKNIFSISR